MILRMGLLPLTYEVSSLILHAIIARIVSRVALLMLLWLLCLCSLPNSRGEATVSGLLGRN